MRDINEIKEELEREKQRLESYLEKEKAMLDPKGVQMYSVGSRSLQRYQTSLGQIQSEISMIRKRIRELESEMKGKTPRRAVGVVLRDW